MKTVLKKIKQRNSRSVKPARIRLSPVRKPKSKTPPALEPVIVLSEAAPQLAAKNPETIEFIPVPAERSDTLHLYLREIGQVKLLTPQEEIVLAKRIRKGDKHAREEMIKANLRLVVKIARDYENLGLPLLDLINEGNIGLMKGVERFDPSKGAKLSTYAAWWIKQAIKRALANQSKTIRLPVHVVDKVAHIRRAETRLRDTLGREPTDDEVADELGLKSHRIRQYRDASRAPVSLDAPIGTEDTTSISEIVADPNVAAPFERMEKENEFSSVQKALATLDQRERTILTMRFGFNDTPEKTLEEVGEHFGLTRERIRQIQEIALKKLRGKMAAEV
ncbi:MAG TPA: sigma-70 family RNA polymerase sigma factor [Candidatus Paceibacterota bacterium]|nr:sigma-70 family RNA polymerase sigma factor [Candidatus Paceibacterota bacterium]